MSNIPGLLFPKYFIPHDITLSILSFVKFGDIVSCSALSKNWNIFVINEISKVQHTKIVKYINALSTNIKSTQTDLKGRLYKIDCSFNTTVANFNSLRNCSHHIRNQIINILALLNNEELRLIDNCDRPIFFLKLLPSTLIYKNYLNNLKIQNEADRFIKIENICLELLKIKDNSKALEVFQNIPPLHVSAKTLNQIFEQLLIAKDFTLALKIVPYYAELKNRDLALRDIVKKMSKSQSFKKAIEIAQIISDKNIQGWALLDITKELSFAGHFNKAQEVANTIFSIDIRKRAISIIYTFSNEIIHAVKIANTICDKGIKEISLVEIIKDLKRIIRNLIEIKGISKTFEIANNLPEENLQKYALSLSYVFADEIVLALEAAHNITHTATRQYAFSDISLKIGDTVKLFIKRGAFFKAYNFANSLPNQIFQKYGLAIFYAKIGMQSRSLEIAQTISWDWMRELTFTEIYDIYPLTLKYQSKICKCLQKLKQIFY